MDKIILFGSGKIAEVVFYYLSNHSHYQVVAITCNKEFIKSSAWNGLPLIPFEEIEEKFPPGNYKMFVALGYQNLNKMREEKVYEAKSKGYKLVSYIHPESGAPKDLAHGENCFIMNNTCIHPRVKIGNNVFVWSGAMVGHHSVIGDNCWLTSCTNISGIVEVGNNCFFAVNSTVADNVKIGNNCFLGANTLVTKTLKDGEVVISSSTPVFRLNSEQFIKLTKF